MKADHLGDLFHRLGFCCGCSELKCFLGNSGLVFIANSKIILSIYNTAAHAAYKQTHTEYETPTVIYTYLKEENKEKKCRKGTRIRDYMQKLEYHLHPDTEDYR